MTDAYGKGIEYSDRMKACTRVVAMMLRTWSGSWYLLPFIKFAHHDIKFTGLIYFCMDGMKAIRTVIDTLRIPSLETRVRWFSPTFRHGS